jgi:hypothetical protein
MIYGSNTIKRSTPMIIDETELIIPDYDPWDTPNLIPEKSSRAIIAKPRLRIFSKSTRLKIGNTL